MAAIWTGRHGKLPVTFCSLECVTAWTRAVGVDLRVIGGGTPKISAWCLVCYACGDRITRPTTCALHEACPTEQFERTQVAVDWLRIYRTFPWVADVPDPAWDRAATLWQATPGCDGADLAEAMRAKRDAPD